MSRVRLLLPIPLAALVGLSAAGAQPPAKDPPVTKEEVLTKPLEDRRDLTLLRRITDDTFVHEAARVSFTVPEGWQEIRPHRLNRKIDPRIITVLGIERADRELVASLYWIPMKPDQTLSHWVRETPAKGEYGEEYETLKTIYGKDRVTTPLKIQSGPFEVYRININGGPVAEEKYDGTLFVFAVESGGTTWLIKARVSYPKGDKLRTDAWAMDVLQGFRRLPATGDVGKKAATVPADDKR